VARDELLGLELEAERLGRVGGHCPFHDLLVGETAVRLRRKCGGGKTPPQISRRKDQAESLGTKEKNS